MWSDYAIRNHGNNVHDGYVVRCDLGSPVVQLFNVHIWYDQKFVKSNLHVFY